MDDTYVDSTNTYVPPSAASLPSPIPEPPPPEPEAPAPQAPLPPESGSSVDLLA